MIPAILAIKISTTNDTNGNPRRGWLVYSMMSQAHNRTDLIAFVDENYAGRLALTRAYPDAIEIASLQVTPGEYREAMRGQREREREAQAAARQARKDSAFRAGLGNVS